MVSRGREFATMAFAGAGDASRAKRVLGWAPRTTLPEFVASGGRSNYRTPGAPFEEPAQA
jgi:hypothetical protein